jgi:autotransporter adhesin
MPETTAIGSNSVASAALATTVGSAAQATGDHAVAIGAVSTARGEASTAIGSGSVADHDNSTAIGADARTTAANQIVLGGVGTSVMIGDLAASTAAQIGPVDVVTADTNGTLGRGQAASMSSVEALGAQTRDLVQQLQISDRQLADMSGRLNLLENRLDKMQSDIHGGIAAAMALGGTMVVPDSTVSLNFNLATYRGQQGFSGTVVARVAPRIYLSGGVAGSTASRSKGSRVGVAIGF